MEKARSQCFDGVLSSAEPHQNIAMYFHVFLRTFQCFFQNAIEEIYNKDASLSIRLKKIFISVRGLQCHRAG
jgi:hypothetical protein